MSNVKLINKLRIAECFVLAILINSCIAQNNKNSNIQDSTANDQHSNSRNNAAEPQSPSSSESSPIQKTANVSYSGSLKSIPGHLLLGVGDTLKTEIDGTTLELKLIGFDQTKLDNLNTRYFRTKFLLHNVGTRDIHVPASKLIFAANDSGFRLSRGAKVYLDTENNIMVKKNSVTQVNFNWHTRAYNGFRGGIAAQRVFIAVNTPIDENINVHLNENSGVFAIYFSESP